jgi:hypothetical protein
VVVQYWEAYHHPDVRLHALIDGIVQHDVHKLIKPAHDASHVAVGIQGHCSTEWKKGTRRVISTLATQKEGG